MKYTRELQFIGIILLTACAATVGRAQGVLTTNDFDTVNLQFGSGGVADTAAFAWSDLGETVASSDSGGSYFVSANTPAFDVAGEARSFAGGAHMAQYAPAIGPTPEPSTLNLLIGGAIVASRFRKRSSSI